MFEGAEYFIPSHAELYTVVRTGETVALSCPFEESDWMKIEHQNAPSSQTITDGDDIELDFADRFERNTTNLVIRGVQEEDNGLYACEKKTNGKRTHEKITIAVFVLKSMYFSNQPPT